MIGVSRPVDGQIEKVVLKFKTRQAPYIKTKPFHGSQRTISEDENGLTVSIEIIPNFELASMILSYGELCEMVEPAALRERNQSQKYQ